MIQHITDNERALTEQVAKLTALNYGNAITIKCYQSQVDELTADLSDMRDDYMRACKAVSDMHMAAMGGVVGPVLGVIEDVAALRAERDSLKSELQAMQDLFMPHGTGDGAMDKMLAETEAIKADAERYRY